jgi:UDP-2,3-diacylglucosamine pyrophosphatase LpxH
MTDAAQNPLNYRSVFISDTHLGAAACDGALLTEFLRNVSCEYLFLIGDIIEKSRPVANPIMDKNQLAAVGEIGRMSSDGVICNVLLGNHDAISDGRLLGFKVHHSVVHRTAAGSRFLVIHGDQFEGRVRRWLTICFAKAGRWLMIQGWPLRGFRGEAGLRRFERRAVEAAREMGCDGVVCGHIHRAGHRKLNDTIYLNDGDWLTSCSAVVEHHDGTMELISWKHLRSLVFGPLRSAQPR